MTVNHGEGSLLFDEDQVLDRVYIVLEGMIKLYHLLPDGQRQITGFLGPGDILGGIKRHATAHCGAEAITEVKLCGFNRARFLQLLRSQPDLCLPPVHPFDTNVHRHLGWISGPKFQSSDCIDAPLRSSECVRIRNGFDAPSVPNGLVIATQWA